METRTGITVAGLLALTMLWWLSIHSPAEVAASLQGNKVHAVLAHNDAAKRKPTRAIFWDDSHTSR
jgi:hypothetical protein